MYRVLIVDDEIMIRRGLSRIIPWGEIGFDLVGAVGDAQEALQIIKEQKIDALLTDISMPEMSGLELIRQARKLQSKIRTVVISGYSEFDYAREAIALKVEEYVLKPLDPDKIRMIFQTIKQELDKEQVEMYYRHSSPEPARLFDQRQKEIIRILEEGLFQEIESLVVSFFGEMCDWENNAICEWCQQTIHTVIQYFHLNKPFIGKLYELDVKVCGMEQIKRCFVEDLEMLAKILGEQSKSTSAYVSSQAKDYIQKNYADKNLSLRELAKQLGVSYGYLSTAFAKTYGENFKSYLTAVRIEKARELLLERRYKIYEIADQVGYGSSRYFTDAFKRNLGISPVEYLNRMSSEMKGGGKR